MTRTTTSSKTVIRMGRRSTRQEIGSEAYRPSPRSTFSRGTLLVWKVPIVFRTRTWDEATKQKVTSRGRTKGYKERRKLFQASNVTSCVNSPFAVRSSICVSVVYGAFRNCSGMRDAASACCHAATESPPFRASSSTPAPATTTSTCKRSSPDECRKWKNDNIPDAVFVNLDCCWRSASDRLGSRAATSDIFQGENVCNLYYFQGERQNDCNLVPNN